MGTTRLLALDVVLLLPGAATSAVARLNARLQSPPAGFRFDDTHLPHITLVQQFVRGADLGAVVRALGHIAAQFPPIALRGAGLARGRTATSLAVTDGATLQRLHARVLDRLGPYTAPPGDAAAFVAEGEPARDADVAWVRHFRAQAAGPRFEPHVTLGVGELGGAAPRIEFTATELAACHLGLFCTCRRVLEAWPLGGAADGATAP